MTNANGSPVKKFVLVGCGSVMAVVLAFGTFCYYVAIEPDGLAVDIECPLDVTVDRPFKLTVKVSNNRGKKDIRLSDIDIEEVYLAAFVVVSVEPSPKSNRHTPLVDVRTFTFDATIKAGSSKSFTFNLRPHKDGLFVGNIDVCEGLRSVSATAQTLVAKKK